MFKSILNVGSHFKSFKSVATSFLFFERQDQNAFSRRLQSSLGDSEEILLNEIVVLVSKIIKRFV